MANVEINSVRVEDVNPDRNVTPANVGLRSALNILEEIVMVVVGADWISVVLMENRAVLTDGLNIITVILWILLPAITTIILADAPVIPTPAGQAIWPV